MTLHADFPAGPTITFTTTKDNGDRLTQFVDRSALEDPRERAICRALLQHALDLLDRSEPTRPVNAAPGSTR
ncbi:MULTISPECIES: hypothetical protein [unclassified Streptomyces]|uniref:hypothetical protein n=1 Tax=unclassified Streptomyces TaxID=2593676 RepID=UPI0013691412|nr:MULTISPECIES: hypothetical protein [unclassified Streptomyces]NDZ98559.1 hypothetical protein [Streptomyces sp. SID10116]MYY79715.1 hypothetical protein [Streptomyces sp. SID335]MYZ12811.1 hypothetical protein [Streptomyces sp. SID337]NDZ84548.1 hypothetical protein [Streptomyces sp. SID10115]NEB43512.1 hypothetical protein [Streptomyces sp. SID339]